MAGVGKEGCAETQDASDVPLLSDYGTEASLLPAKFGFVRRELVYAIGITIFLWAIITIPLFLRTRQLVGREFAYSLAVADIDGLDMSLDAMDPVFNLTVRAYLPRDTRYEQCSTPGSTAKVSYRGALLAEGPFPWWCIRPSSEKASVVARGRGVRLPGHLRDLLADELRCGTAELNVAAKVLLVGDYNSGNLVSCTVGVADGPHLLRPCTMTSFRH